MSWEMESNLWGTQILTGHVVLATKRALVGVVSKWGRRLFPSSTGSRSQWHLAQQRRNT